MVVYSEEKLLNVDNMEEFREEAKVVYDTIDMIGYDFTKECRDFSHHFINITKENFDIFEQHVYVYLDEIGADKNRNQVVEFNIGTIILTTITKHN